MTNANVEHNKAFDSAQEEAREAAAALREAIDRMHRAADRVIRATLRFHDTPASAAQWLIREANSRTATWSGGPTNPTNVVEAIQREAAVQTLAGIRLGA